MAKSIAITASSEAELEWYKTIYQGDRMPQLTVRAVVMGSFLGAFMALSNLYVGLKIGWGLGVSITACILSFTIYRTLHGLLPGWFPTEMSILENNCMQSTATSAGVSSGSTMVSAVSAYLMITGHHIHWPVLVAWTFFLAALGVFLAVPMKRQMINVEQLRFPSGTATAETLRSLHAKGKEAVAKARALGIAGLIGALVTWFREIKIPFSIPSMLPFPGKIAGYGLSSWTISFEMSTIMIAAGGIMGWRIAWSMLLGGILNYGFLAPQMLRLGAIDGSHLGFRAIVTWSTWTGASMMVTSGLFMFFAQWRTVVKAFSGVFAIFIPHKQSKKDALSAVEVPDHWFLIGTAVSGLGCMIVLHEFFGTSYWMGALAIFMTFFLCVVACRATGETDITPIGAMGKVTQLMFGALAPANMVTNLMTASVTAGAAGSSADLLTDLKSGYLLGANARKQFIAQFLGIFAGTAVIVPAFYILVPNAASLGSSEWPAPAAQVWAAVARLLSTGVHSLHPTARMGMFIGGSAGILIPVLEMIFPKRKKFIPSAMGIGLAFVIPFFNSLSMFIGALIALILEKKRPEISEKYVVAVCSGLIAGESLLGVLVAILSATGVIK